MARRRTAESGRLGGEVRAASRSFVPPAPRPATAVPAADPKPDVSGKETTAGYQPGTFPRSAGEAWALARSVFREFGEGNGSLMAASVAFYLLLSLIPLVLVAIAIFGYVMGNVRAEASLFTFLQSYIPGQGEVVRGAIDKVREARGAIGGIGLVSLLFTATGGFATLETAVNVQWEVKNRNFVWAKVFSFLMMLLVGVLFVLSFGITETVSWAGRIPALHWLAQNWLLRVVGFVLPIGISALMFGFIYKLFPNVHVSWRSALASGVVTAVLWELFKIGYALYSKRTDQSLTYGTLGSFVGLIMWIYYSSTLILLGSELTRLLEGRSAPPPAPPQPA